jgi:NAD(P)-dependent dehydrogenase (short-subunit alcohol dehydrogenase family)
MDRLAGQTAVITGCASGIGLAIARRFVAEGARVVGLDVREQRDVTHDADAFRMVVGSVAE